MGSQLSPCQVRQLESFWFNSSYSLNGEKLSKMAIGPENFVRGKKNPFDWNMFKNQNIQNLVRRQTGEDSMIIMQLEITGNCISRNYWEIQKDAFQMYSKMQDGALTCSLSRLSKIMLISEGGKIITNVTLSRISRIFYFLLYWYLLH